jgi:hypothetical protein
MSRNVAPMWVVPLIIAFAIAGLAPFGARAQMPGQNWTQSGMLRCMTLLLRRSLDSAGALPTYPPAQSQQ